jgi:hypothetical protein
MHRKPGTFQLRVRFFIVFRKSIVGCKVNVRCIGSSFIPIVWVCVQKFSFSVEAAILTVPTRFALLRIFLPMRGYNIIGLIFRRIKFNGTIEIEALHRLEGKELHSYR